jgi:hypothetical protein
MNMMLGLLYRRVSFAEVTMRRFLRIFGFVLLLGGLGHTEGIVQHYLREGVPDWNRVLLDIWIGQAQLLGGALYFLASHRFEQGTWRPLAIFGALTVIGLTGPMLPVLFQRASILLRIPSVIYFVLSLLVLVLASRREQSLSLT